MPVELDPIYLVYLLVAVSAGLFFEGIYLLCFSGASYRSNVNRRLKLLKNEPNREALLIQLRRERGLTRSGGYAFGIESLNRLVLQSGLTVGTTKLVIIIAASSVSFSSKNIQFAQFAILISVLLPREPRRVASPAQVRAPVSYRSVPA